MKTVRVSASKSYDVKIGSGLLNSAGQELRTLLPRAQRAAVISDDNVAPIYMSRLLASLEKAGFECCRYVFPHGEESKNGENYLKILSFLAQNRLTRTDLLIALGGGVVGDITGFAAASYLRGTSFVQLPTSLLAMVDSSVGGKTAIDLPEGKNLAGAFCQPELVLCDLDTLDTLSPAFFTDGCAEVIKYGILEDKALFAHLMEKGQGFEREYVISRCVEIKRDYVCEDEFDNGVRKKLNLGHTVGHAIEKLSSYSIPHGSAVAMGTAVIARAADTLGLCGKEVYPSVLRGLEKLSLPTRCPYSADELIAPMLSDKKRSGGSISLIIPRAIGDCPIFPIAVDELEKFVKAGL